MNNKGKILRLKTGYNPNSSSVGSHIPVFLAFAAGAGAVSMIIMNLISSTSKNIRNRKNDIKQKD